ncbi:GNAT family N-acetyltransferase [Thiomicrorhabdus indica]|uniref:GNAT family N-acetyltransferase n=1 Tax=Thiomicrorhabdus indica TaxID=2267253 RepID=UPI002AA7BB02|nr:GNAT family N-acetyltransferase [Thiomicrorhabdus indica]
MQIIEVKTLEEVQILSNLAQEIWHQHFTSIIGQDQVSYMLKHFQSTEAIWKQIQTGAEYYFLKISQIPVAYICLIADSNKKRMMLSKLYVKDSERGKGLGKSLLQFSETRAIQKNCNDLWLTVNRFNADSIEWYSRQGFVVIDEVKKDIGQGYFMDDYIMEKAL